MWDRAVTFWRSLPGDAGAVFDREVTLDGGAIAPMVTWGTSPQDAVPVTGAVPEPAMGATAERREAMAAALAYIRSRPEIWEVILTGGDPLMLSPRRLGAIVAALSAIPHIETIRIHTRVPVADPERVNDALVAALETDRSVWVVVHANHAREFSAEARAALRRIQARAVPVLGQSVLLRGVNDSAEALEALFEKIKRDDRHADATILVLETAAQRLFPMWAMRHDPARSWMWTREQVSQGAVEAATRDEVLAIFVRLVTEQPGHLSGVLLTCPASGSKP